jgi:hypothetical protein
MYMELKTENASEIDRLLAQMRESAEPVQITLSKRDGLYHLDAVCKKVSIWCAARSSTKRGCEQPWQGGNRLPYTHVTSCSLE